MDGLRHGRLPLKQRPLPPLVVALAAALALLLLVVVTPTATAFVHHGRIPSIGPLQQQQQQQRRDGFAPRPPTPPPLRAIKGVETFGGDFTLSPEVCSACICVCVCRCDGLEGFGLMES